MVDPVYFINEWVWTYDPREEVSYLPFIMYPRQVEFINWLWQLEKDQVSGVADKSRDMGFTWLCAAYFVHRWLFRKGFAGGFGSRKQDLVDKIGDPDSIFEKMRIILRMLPGWLMPSGFDWKLHDNFLRLVNPDNDAIISGEAGDNIGRGGRKTMYIVDEAAWLQRPLLIDAALSNNTKIILYVSTPNGPGNPFAKKRFSGAYRTFTMHWSQDPRKAVWVAKDKEGNVLHTGVNSVPPEWVKASNLVVSYPWYEDQKARFDPITVAQEVDIDYNASIEGVICPGRWVRAAIEFGRKMQVPELPPVAGFDVAAEGSNENALIIRRGPVVRESDVHVWDHTDTFVTAKNAAAIVRSSGAKKVNFDGDGIGASIAGNWAHEPNLGFEWVGLRNGWRPSKRRWENGKTSEQMFVNLRAEMWFTLRRRLEKTFEFMEYGVDYPLDELIALPDNQKLTMQLSLPLYEKGESGKIKVESKDAMKARGVKSPDLADALVFTFAPEITRKVDGSNAYSQEQF
jgi:phage terminase large subunit